MANSEIKIDEYEIKNCKGNIIKLQNDWNSVPKFSKTPAKKSSGHSADSINSCSDAAHQVSKSFTLLLTNSTQFFENVGVSFKESDESAANSIKSK